MSKVKCPECRCAFKSSDLYNQYCPICASDVNKKFTPTLESTGISDEAKIFISTLICVLSFGLLQLAQIPTPEYLNPVGCLFATIWMVSGMYAGVTALFTWG